MGHAGTYHSVHSDTTKNIIIFFINSSSTEGNFSHNTSVTCRQVCEISLESMPTSKNSKP